MALILNARPEKHEQFFIECGGKELTITISKLPSYRHDKKVKVSFDGDLDMKISRPGKKQKPE